MTRDPIQTITNFCLVQLELVKMQETKLKREIENCHIQKEFLLQTLKDLEQDFEEFLK
jgi:hypothetical protein